MTEQTISTQKDISKGKPSFFSRLSLWWVGIMAFIFPLFALPPLWQNLHINKSIFLFAGVFIGYVFWWTGRMREKKFVFKFAFQDFLILVFLVFYGISAVLGGRRGYALFEFSQTQWALSLLGVLALFYFLVKNILSSEDDVKFLLKSVTIGGVAAVVLNILVYLGIAKLPTNFLGQLSGTGVFAALLCVLSLAISSSAKKNFSKIFFAALSITSFAVLLLIDFNICWYVFLAVGLMYLAVKFWRFKISNLEFNLLFLFLIVALAFLFLSSSQIFHISLPGEVWLNQQTSWHIIYPVIKEHPLFGTGFNSFGNNFLKFRSPSLNRTIVWNVKFRQPSSTFFAMLNNAGLVGITLLLLIFFLAVKRAILNICRGKSVLVAAAGVIILGLVVAAFLYNFPLFLAFFAMVIIGILGWREGHKVEVKFEESQKGRLLTNALMILSLLSAFIVGYFVLRVYLGETYYARAVAVANTQDVQKIDSFDKAMRRAIYWDPYEKNYYTTYISVMFAAAAQEAKKAKPNMVKYQKWVKEAVNNGAFVAKKYSNDADLLARMGDIYSQLIFSVSGADKFALESYKKAINIDPTNPVLYTNLGIAQLKKIALDEMQSKSGEGASSNQPSQQKAKTGEEERQALLKEAIANFQKAIELKADYLPAHYNLAQAYEKENKPDEALKELDLALAINSNNVDVIFEKGKILLSENKLAQAQKEFERAVSIFPQHSNSLYLLGVVLSKQGKN
ncbi:MAG: tetratricopeptide repeat protein, partial [Candidatus Heimdallarchaeota archaeon]